MRVRTFYDDTILEGILDLEDVFDPTTQKLLRVKLDNGKTVVRHRTRIEPLDEEAKKVLCP